MDQSHTISIRLKKDMDLKLQIIQLTLNIKVCKAQRVKRYPVEIISKRYKARMHLHLYKILVLNKTL